MSADAGEIRTRIEAWIAHDRGSDEQLPTEREMAKRLDVSRHVVRKVLGQLEIEGRLWRHVGRGTFAGARPAFDKALAHVAVQHSSPREIVEVRQTLEPQIAAMAALRATAAQLTVIEDAHKRCSAARSLEHYEIWDEKLHLSIAAATGNVLLHSIFATVNQARKKVVWGRMRRAALRPERRAFFVAQHARIVNALRERNGDGAREAMRNHLATTAEVYAVLDNPSGQGGRVQI